MALNVFSSAEVDSIVRQQIPANINYTHVVVGSVGVNGAQIVASFKQSADSKWEVQAVAQHEWNGNNSVGAKVLLHW